MKDTKKPDFKNVCHFCGDTSGRCDCNLPCKCGKIMALCICDKDKEKRLKKWAQSRGEWI